MIEDPDGFVPCVGEYSRDLEIVDAVHFSGTCDWDGNSGEVGGRQYTPVTFKERLGVAVTCRAATRRREKIYRWTSMLAQKA